MQAQNTLKRYSLSAAAAVFITGGLILVMHYAIHTEEPTIVDVGPLVPLDIVRLKRDEEIRIEPPEIEQIKPIDEPPVPQRIPTDLPGTQGGYVNFTPPKDGPPIDIEGSTAEGGLLPIMTVLPEYPDRMAARGVEGWVLVEFAVDEIGRVDSPRVIDAQPASGFNRSALRAVLRYKYKPRVINGEAVRVEGVRQRIVFNMGI